MRKKKTFNQKGMNMRKWPIRDFRFCGICGKYIAHEDVYRFERIKVDSWGLESDDLGDKIEWGDIQNFESINSLCTKCIKRICGEIMFASQKYMIHKPEEVNNL